MTEVKKQEIITYKKTDDMNKIFAISQWGNLYYKSQNSIKVLDMSSQLTQNSLRQFYLDQKIKETLP